MTGRHTRAGGIRTGRTGAVAGPRSRAMIAVFASIAALATGVASTTPLAPTLASWTEDEWASGTLGVPDCGDPATTLASRGEGQLLSGRMLGTDLATVVEASGVTVTNDGETATPSPNGNPADPSPFAWANPLNVTALSAIDIDLGQGLLQLPLNNSTGVIGQYGMAAPTGHSVGASGLVTDNGAVATEPGDGYPELAALDLKSLVSAVNPELANTLAGVTDLSVETGAVAGRAAIDGCAEAFDGQTMQTVSRQYLATDARTTLSSPTVATTVSTLESTLSGLDSALGTLIGSGGLVSGITSGLTGLLDGLLSGILLGIDIPTVAVDIDTASILRFAAAPFSDANGIVEIALGEGRVSVDLVALLQQAYPETYSSHLNGLPPNTELLVNDAILSALVDTVVSTSVSTWLDRLITVVLEAISVHVVVDLDVRLLQLVPLAALKLTVDGNLRQLLDGERVTTTEASGALWILQPLIDPLVRGLGGVVGNVINGALNVASTLQTALQPVLQSIVSLLSTIYDALYLDGILSITVNAQNDPLSGGPEPADWASFPQGRYDVAALRIGILDALGEYGVALYLGRGSVGLLG